MANASNLAAISVQDYVRALRVFFSWLFREGYTNENRLARLRPPKAPTKVVEILTQEEMAGVLGCISPNTSTGARDYAILVLLLDTGLRCSELTSSELGDINIEGGFPKVMGEGGKERIVPFGATVQRALLRYLLHFRPEPFNTGYSEFLPHLGRQAPGLLGRENDIQTHSREVWSEAPASASMPAYLLHELPDQWRRRLLPATDIGAYDLGDGRAICELGLCPCYGSAQEVLANGQTEPEQSRKSLAKERSAESGIGGVPLTDSRRWTFFDCQSLDHPMSLVSLEGESGRIEVSVVAASEERSTAEDDLSECPDVI